ncbi:MAG: hypothetical protein ACMUHM_02925 [Thermoplasmatota archaeon]
MAAVTGSDKYSRIETFLDNIDQVRDPSQLEEPFRSLWLRMHGDLPTLMSEEDTRIALTGVAVDDLSDVEITSSDEQGGTGPANSSIEVVSPKDVGPTFEMKVEDKRVKFKAAGEEDLLTIKVKEEAAAKVVNVQKITAPLKGIGGGAAKVTSKVRDMALFYRDAKYEDVIRLATDIEGTVKDEDFRKSMLIEVQKKISEYEALGGDLSLTKERFKELSAAFKDNREDFLPLLQATNKLAEDSIKDLISTEEVLIADVKEAAVEEAPLKVEEEKAVPPKKEKPKLPGETAGPEKKVEVEEETGEEEEAAPKPVIKIVKKKVVVLKMRDEEEKPKEAPAPPSGDEEPEDEEEDFSIDLEEEGMEEEEEEASEEVPKVDKIMAEQKEGVQKALEKTAKDQPDKSAVESAFKKIQVVYNASVKLHEQGKDVAKIFDIMNMAEQARQKGDLKMYVGLAGQLESMLIAMQK